MQTINMRRARKAHRAESWIPPQEILDDDGRILFKAPGRHRTRFRAWLRSTFATPQAQTLFVDKVAKVWLSGDRP
jgi:hypothetical protein